MAIDCLILGPAYPYRGGISDTNQAFAEELINQGLTTEIWTFTNLYPSFLFPGTSQFSLEKKEYPFPIKRKIHAYNPFTWNATAREINTLKPKKIIFRYWTPLLALVWGAIAKKLNSEINKIALVDNWTHHEPKPWDKKLNHYLSNSVNYISTLSENVYSEVIEDVKIPVSKGFHPINNNLPDIINESTARNKLKLDPKKPIILFFGLIRSYKGLDLLIDALADPSLFETEVELLVVGEFYENINQYEKQIKKLGLESRIHIINEFVSFEIVRDYFCASNIVAQPYKSATQSGITPLAYHYEVPMVVTDLKGLKTPVLKDKTGRISKSNSSDIAFAISELLILENLKKAKNNIKKSKVNYSWNYFVKEWIYFTENK